MKKSIFAFSLILTSLLSCSESDDNLYEDSVCDQITTVDNNRYKNNQSEGFLIRSVQIIGDCLEVEIESGGCSGDTWKVELIDAGRVAESNPEQRDLKVLLENEKLCNAIVFKTYTFDLRSIQTRNNVVLLNLDLWDEQIRYEY
jgi:hypothetical protein